jgi:glycosyltransferase involved in cell wall biosynthesis
MKLSIVVPAHNEEENIAAVIEQIEKEIPIPFELIVVNDHSTDRTNDIVSGLSGKYTNIILIENKLSAGFANAVKTGLSSIRTGVAVLVMGDLCDDLRSIPVMFEKIVQGYDVVCGSRYIKKGARLGGSKIKGFFSCFVGKSLHYLLGIPTYDVPNAFKMYRKEVIDSIDIKSKGFEISMEMALKAYYLGFKITEIPTIWKERTKGKSDFRMLELLPNYLKLYIWAILRSFFPFTEKPSRIFFRESNIK